MGYDTASTAGNGGDGGDGFVTISYGLAAVL